MRSKADIDAGQVKRPGLLISLQLALSPMVVYAIGIEYALAVAMDCPQHSHLSEDHRAAVLGLPQVGAFSLTVVKKSRRRRPSIRR